ncbi:MAG TPA: hypothetical protein DEP72_06350 [Clostridiales bacterium]|nr:MAG: hypothetical protein A2Y18_00145 [Clostridiales bacterium GWD2_32_19]HCC07759.1 hypothetical protein [Clostridiales bacterium]
MKIIFNQGVANINSTQKNKERNGDMIRKYKIKWLFILLLSFMVIFPGKGYADFTYTVKSGDTLYLISKAYSVSITSIKTANNLTTDYLYVNQKLTIPTDKIIQYTVISGDTLWKISQKYNTTIDRIKTLNNLTSDYLTVGQVLIIEKDTIVSNVTYASYRTHTVKAGDNLWSIGVLYDVTISGIKTLNGLTSDYLTIGQVLKIPASIVYTLDSIVESKLIVFPFKAKTDYQAFTNSYAAARDYSTTGTVRVHEGQDIMANKGTPVYAMGAGVITNIGWNEYGGYRIMIKLDGINYSLYYAHFSKYADGMYIGKKVSAGELVGYVGDTGYGPEGTTGKFAPHLHVGIYKTSDMTTINPYPYLKKLSQ